MIYDISDGAIQDKIRKIGKRFLNHIQFSVFEGELKQSQYTQFLLELKETSKYLADNEGIIVFKINIESKIDRIVIGHKGELRGNIL